MFGLGVAEMVIIGIVAVLLFGSKLPEVAKTIGGSYREFKKGLSEFQISLHDMTSDAPAASSRKKQRAYQDYDDYDQAPAPRFDPPPAPALEAPAAGAVAEAPDPNSPDLS